MNIYTYLKKDHRKVADMMEEVIAASSMQQRKSLFAQIKQELTLHADTEEATFYKAIDDATSSKAVEEKLEHADHEHQEIRDYLQKLSASGVKDDVWMELFGELKHAVTHHVEEEEGEIFEKARKYLSESEAVALAKEMDAMKKEQMKKHKAA